MNSKKIKNKEVNCVYWSDKVKSYNVSIPEGKFIVMDYGDDDREVFWASGVFPVSAHTAEYGAASDTVDYYLDDI
jgi:hypothetical protein